MQSLKESCLHGLGEERVKTTISKLSAATRLWDLWLARRPDNEAFGIWKAQYSRFKENERAR